MSSRSLELHAFDATRIDAGTRLGGNAERSGSVLSLRWELSGPLVQWTIPPLRPEPKRRDRLWEATCFEAFLSPAAAASYWEINLSPAGDWNVYRFNGYRRGMRLEARVEPPVFHATTDGERTLAVTVAFDLNPMRELARIALDVALAAVLEEAGGARSYWALRHEAAQPDFHRRETFVVTLPAEEIE